jgi:hypothetical protein
MPIKMLACTLCFSWQSLIIALAIVFSSWDNVLTTGNFPMFLVMCLIGLIYFYSPIEVPLMARRRQQANKNPFAALGYYFFRPGPHGTGCAILLMWVLSMAYLCSFWYIKPFIISTSGYSPSMEQEIADYAFIALPLMAPFFIAFPAGLLLNFRKLRTRLVALRMSVLLWWAISGVVMLIILTAYEETASNDSGSTHLVVFFLSFLFSPISSAMAPGFHLFRDIVMTCPARCIFGLGGFFLMIRTLRRRELLQASDKENASSLAGIAQTMPAMENAPAAAKPEPAEVDEY